MIVDLDSWETGYADGQLARRRNARSSLIRHRTRWVSAKVAPPARECARTRGGCVILCYRLRFASDGRAKATAQSTVQPLTAPFDVKSDSRIGIRADCQ